MKDAGRYEPPQVRPDLACAAPVRLRLEDGTRAQGRGIGIARPVCREVAGWCRPSGELICAPHRR
jgi:hypothetical protein